MFTFLLHYFLEKYLTMNSQGKFNSTRHSIFRFYMQMRCQKIVAIYIYQKFIGFNRQNIMPQATVWVISEKIPVPYFFVMDFFQRAPAFTVMK